MYKPKYGILESIDGYIWILTKLKVYDGNGFGVFSALDILKYYARY